MEVKPKVGGLICIRKLGEGVVSTVENLQEVWYLIKYT